MKRIVNALERRPDTEVVEGFRELLKIYSPSCVVADSMERAGVMHSSVKSWAWPSPSNNTRATW